MRGRTFVLIPILLFGMVEIDIHPSISGTDFPFAGTSSADSSAYTYINQSDADRILGQRARSQGCNTEKKDGILRYSCTYGGVQDARTKQPCNLYYLLEEYRDASSAHEVYNDIVMSNANMPGQERIDSLGDEAWMHSDGRNFQLILVRKNNKMMRIKINKITRTISPTVLQTVTREMVSKL